MMEGARAHEEGPLGLGFPSGGERARETGRIMIQVNKAHKGSKQAECAALAARSYLPEPVILEAGAPAETSSKLG